MSLVLGKVPTGTDGADILTGKVRLVPRHVPKAEYYNPPAAVYYAGGDPMLVVGSLGIPSKDRQITSLPTSAFLLGTLFGWLSMAAVVFFSGVL